MFSRVHSEEATYVVETSAKSDDKGNDGSNGTTDGSSVFSLNAQSTMSDTSGEQGSIGGVNERSRGTVKFSKEDKEESEGGGFGKVSMSTNGALKLSNVVGAVGLLSARTVDFVRFTGTEVDVGVESVHDDVGGEVGVVSCEEGRVRQRGLFVVQSVDSVKRIWSVRERAFVVNSLVMRAALTGLRTKRGMLLRVDWSL